MKMNKKDLRIKKYWQLGLNERSIARKLGYSVNIEEGIVRVKEGLFRTSAGTGHIKDAKHEHTC